MRRWESDIQKYADSFRSWNVVNAALYIIKINQYDYIN